MILISITNLNQYPELLSFINSQDKQEQRALAQNLGSSYNILLGSPTGILSKSILNIIVKHGTKQPQWMSPLSIVSILGRYDLFDVLLSEPLDDDDEIFGLACYALGNAALGGSVDIVQRIMIELDKNPLDHMSYRDYFKESGAWIIQDALSYAAVNGHDAMLHYLLQLELIDINARFNSETLENCLKMIRSLTSKNAPEFIHTINCLLTVPWVGEQLYENYIEKNEPNYLLKDVLRTGNLHASILFLEDQIAYTLRFFQQNGIPNITRALSLNFTEMTLDNRSIETLILALKENKHPLGLQLYLRSQNGSEAQREEIEKLCQAPLINAVIIWNILGKEIKHSNIHDIHILNHIFSFLFPEMEPHLLPNKCILYGRFFSQQNSTHNSNESSNNEEEKNGSPGIPIIGSNK